MPIHLLPPWWRPFCSASRSRSFCISASKLPAPSIAARSSSVSSFSASFSSHSRGRVASFTSASTGIVSRPEKLSAKARS